MKKNSYSQLITIVLIITTFMCFSAVPETMSLTECQPNQRANSAQKDNLIHKSAIRLDAYSFGHQYDFWTADLRANTWFQVRATLLSVGVNCYVYMDNRTIATIGQSLAIERCNIYSDEFDRTIYPKNLELMGHPDGTLGDIDGDPRITIFLVEDVGSYYLQSNELSYSTYSNAREMIYVSSEMQVVQTIPVICHETNHLFLFNYDLDEAVYFIEGLAEYSMYHAGYLNNQSYIWSELNLNNSVSSYYYSQNPDSSLFFFDDSLISYASYGAGYLFLLYISEQYGSNIISELVHLDVLDGPSALEYVLLENGYNISFNEVFLNFITACTIDQLGIYDNQYGFTNTDFQIYERKLIRNLPSTSTEATYRYYGIAIQELENPPNKFTLQIETPDSSRSLGLSVVINDINGYNVTQSIITGTGNSTYIHLTGENITTAYVISSMIKEGTPSAVRIWGSSPINLLDLSFQSGHIEPVTNETHLIFISVVVATITIVFSYGKIRKKKTRLSSL